MTKHKYDPTQVTIEIGGEVLHNVVPTTEFVVRLEIYSTQTLQIESLCEYARSLGYVPRDVEMIGRGFEYVDMRSWHSHYCSFSDMCTLHNLEPLHLNGKIKRELRLSNLKLDIPVMQLQFARHNKLVENVKLQRDKNGYGGIKCQSNMIKLTEKGRDYCKNFSRYNFLLEE